MADHKRKIHTVNADNEFLEPLAARHFVIGQVDQVNGAGAEELPFMPTRHELLELVKYWVREILNVQYFWFLYAGTGSTEMRVESFAWRRIKRIAELLGDDAVKGAFDEAEGEFRKSCDPQHWEIFKRGNEAEYNAVRDEIRAKTT